MKILIVGSQGMAGHMLEKYFKLKKIEVYTVARNNANICVDIEQLQLNDVFFQNIKNNYDFVINCVGLLVKNSIDRPDRAAIINSWFPHALEFSLRDSKTKLIHLSTDCVFDGTKGNYVEKDIHTEINAYGRSKSLGEVDNYKDITFRMSIIGPEIKSNGTGLFHWLCNNSDTKINGWSNAYWNGITTLELAKSIDQYMNNPNISGVYHLVNNKNCISKFNLLKLIDSQFNLNKHITELKNSKDINKCLVDTRQEINFSIPNYIDMIKELKIFMNSTEYQTY